MTERERPTLQSFLTAPLEEVASVAPKTVIFAAGGTRRSAMLAGIADHSEEYVRWTRRQMIDCFDMLFRHGVSHILTFAIIETQVREVTERYSQRLLDWVEWGLAGPEALSDYKERAWRVRLHGTEALPPLAPAAQRLQDATDDEGQHSVWWFVVADEEHPWERVLKAAGETGVSRREELVEAIYGRPIPPATLFLSFGKPMVSASLLPPLLTGQLQCYWVQQPGYRLDKEQWRHILYDYAYLRPTWREDKSGRAKAVLEQRSFWEKGPILGLGVPLGPFWYPAPFPGKPSGTNNDGD